MKSPLLTYSIFTQKPWGPLIACFQDAKLCYLTNEKPHHFFNWANKRGAISYQRKIPPLFQRQLKSYFRGKLKRFSYPILFLTGTPFEKKVWKTLQTIPYGEVKSYAWVARKIGQPKAARAVGQAGGKNPIPIVIPCHRVIRSNGSLGGYSGGIGFKRKLLELEGINFRR